MYNKAHIVIKTPDNAEPVYMFPLQENNNNAEYVPYIAMCKIFNTWHAVSKPIYVDEASTLSIYYGVPSLNSLLLLDTIHVDNSLGFSRAELLMPHASNSAPMHCVSVLCMRKSGASCPKLLRIPYIKDFIRTLFVAYAQKYPTRGNTGLSGTCDYVCCVCSQEERDWDKTFEHSMQEHIRQCHVYEDCYECRQTYSPGSV